MATDPRGATSRSDEESRPTAPHLRDGTHGASVTPLVPRREVAAPPSGRPSPAAPGSLREATARLTHRRREAVDGPDPEATIRRGAQGKLTARERIAVLLDEGSF